MSRCLNVPSKCLHKLKKKKFSEISWFAILKISATVEWKRSIIPGRWIDIMVWSTNFQAASDEQWMWTLPAQHSPAEDRARETNAGGVCGTGEKSTAAGQTQNHLSQTQVRERRGENQPQKVTVYLYGYIILKIKWPGKFLYHFIIDIMVIINFNLVIDIFAWIIEHCKNHVISSLKYCT